MKCFIIYYRVSTKKQEVSGLGLEAQQTIVSRFLPEGADVVATFTEIESGKRSNRPQLKAAIAACKASGATLVVAKLDRLARNVLFTATLMDSKVDFVACDIPYANRLTIHIMAAMAEDEARRISERTRGALAELKARGVKLGSARPGHWDGREHLRGWNGVSPQKAALLKRERLEETYGSILPLVLVLRKRGETMKSIAEALNSQGFTTPRGSQYDANAVKRVLDRHERVAA